MVEIGDSASPARNYSVSTSPSQPDGEPDILQHCASEVPDVSRDLFWRAKRGERVWKAVRSGPNKYIHMLKSGQEEEWLFDLSSDASETTPLNASRPKVLRNLKEKLALREAEVRPER